MEIFLVLFGFLFGTTVTLWGWKGDIREREKEARARVELLEGRIRCKEE